MSRSQISTAYFIGTLTGAAALPTVGRWIDRSGGHKVIALISSAFRAVLVAMAGIQGGRAGRPC